MGPASQTHDKKDVTLPGTNMEVNNGPERKTMKSTTNRWCSTSMLLPGRVVFHFSNHMTNVDLLVKKSLTGRAHTHGAAHGS